MVKIIEFDLCSAVKRCCSRPAPAGGAGYACSPTTAPIRLLFVTLYVAAAMAALGAIGLAVSTLIEHAIGVIAAVMILVVTSEVVDNGPQLAAGPYLPTHWWLSFDALLRAPVDISTLLRELLSFAAYTLIFGDFAWARFTSADVTS
jgi:ABC-2 type transport system permease protein